MNQAFFDALTAVREMVGGSNSKGDNVQEDSKTVLGKLAEASAILRSDGVLWDRFHSRLVAVRYIIQSAADYEERLEADVILCDVLNEMLNDEKTEEAVPSDAERYSREFMNPYGRKEEASV